MFKDGSSLCEQYRLEGRADDFVPGAAAFLTKGKLRKRTNDKKEYFYVQKNNTDTFINYVHE